MSFGCPPEVILRRVIRYANPRMSLFQASGTKSLHRAVLCTELGKPLQMQNVTNSLKPKKGQVLVSVHAAAVNFSDTLLCAGKYQVKVPLPFVPGSEFSGCVEEIGEGVKNLQNGDHVVAINMIGGFADYAVVDSNKVIKIPSTTSYSTAAALIVSYSTSMLALTRNARLKKGETLLVTAAAGGVGLAAVEIAANVIGAHVIAACGGPEKCALARAKGATHVIDYKTEKIRNRVKEITNGKGVDVVYDPVGGDMFLDCIKSLAFEGRALTIGYASGTIPKVPANLLLLNSSSLVGAYWGNYSERHPEAFRQSIEDTLRCYHEGKLQPHIGKEFALEKVNDAMHFISSRESTGKVIIKVKDD